MELKKNSDLAIAIPTYNRAAILIENIILMLDEVKKYSIPIYISDDSPNDETKEMFLELKKSYDYIFYKKNSPSLGHDKNCISTLTYPSEKFSWYIGDSTIIVPGGIELILSHISIHNPDIISVNAQGRNLKNENTWYSDGNLLLKEVGWHLTLTGATIYSKKLIENYIHSLDLARCVNFPQTAVIFKGFEAGNCKLYFENAKLIRNNSKKSSYWQKNLFQVFLRDWPNCINNFNYLREKDKQIGIIKHSRETELFNFKSLVSYRAKGFFGLREFVSFFQELKSHSTVNIFGIFIITLTPKFIFSLFNKIRKVLR